MLVGRGFSLNEITHMTLSQLQLYLEASGRAEKRVMWQATISTLAGSRYDQNGLDKLQRQLEAK
jgi:hypothetical protein